MAHTVVDIMHEICTTAVCIAYSSLTFADWCYWARLRETMSISITRNFNIYHTLITRFDHFARHTIIEQHLPLMASWSMHSYMPSAHWRVQAMQRDGRRFAIVRWFDTDYWLSNKVTTYFKHITSQLMNHIHQIRMAMRMRDIFSMTVLTLRQCAGTTIINEKQFENWAHAMRFHWYRGECRWSCTWNVILGEQIRWAKLHLTESRSSKSIAHIRSDSDPMVDDVNQRDLHRPLSEGIGCIVRQYERWPSLWSRCWRTHRIYCRIYRFSHQVMHLFVSQNSDFEVDKNLTTKSSISIIESRTTRNWLFHAPLTANASKHRMGWTL